MEFKVAGVDEHRMRVLPEIVPSTLPEDERKAMVWNYRLQGYSYKAIAKLLHEKLPPGSLPSSYSAKQVYADCVGVLAEMRNEFKETAIEMVEIEANRFDKMQEGIWAKAEAGDIQAINAVLAISKERRKMLGLDDPNRIKVDWRIELVELVRGGLVKPEEILLTFGEEALVEVNQLMLESHDDN